MGAIPNFLIIGAQKAGTTAAARNVAQHPDITMFAGTTEYGQKEIEFFNQHWDRGLPWYASHFTDSTVVVGEKTAELLHRTLCHKRMWEANSELKLLVLLRSPVDRAFSQWKMAALHKCDECESFESVIEREVALLDEPFSRERLYSCTSTGVSNWREGYLLKGMYAEQILSVFKWFAREQVFIGISERFRRDPSSEYGRLFEFLGVRSFSPTFGEHFVGRPYPPMSSRLRSLLDEVYKVPNEQLYALLGTDIPEWRKLH